LEKYLKKKKNAYVYVMMCHPPKEMDEERNELMSLSTTLG